MQTSKWDRVQEVFFAVADLPAAARRTAVEQYCGSDAALADQVLSLLAHDANMPSFLRTGLPGAAEATLADPSLQALMEQQIGPYRLLRMLGEGGMGVVFLAERTDIGGHVAIKLLRNAWMSPMRRERFAQEQSLLAILNHPHIARIYDASTLPDGTPWFVMEYVNGLPFSEWVATRPRDLRSDLRVFLQVCEAVRYAHLHAIVHRDLKPSNILVNEEGVAKLLDFGIAKQLTESRDACVTIDGLQIMTPAYAAPEQVSGQAVGTFTDVYALGVLLYEMLTGTLPWTGRERETNRALARPSLRASTGVKPPRYQLSRREWADLDALCLSALKAEPEERYLSADALSGDLEAYLEGRPLAARAPSFSYQAAKFVRRHRAVLISIAACLVLVCAGAVAFTLRLERAKNAALAEVARTERLQRFTRSLFDGGDPAGGRSQDLTTAMLLKRGEVEAESLSSDPRMQADMLSTLGTAYQGLGQLDRANVLLQRALRKREQVGGKPDKLYVESLVGLGLLRRDQSRLDEAEALLHQAVKIDREQRNAGHLGRALWALSSTLNLHGKYGESRPLLEEAVQLDKRPGGNRTQYADDVSELADVHIYLDDYPAAVALDQQALGIYQQEYGSSHLRVGQVLNTLGQIAQNQGRYSDSEAFFRQSLGIEESWYGPEHPDVADGLAALAKVLTSTTRYDEADALLTRALAIQIRTYGHQHSRVALVLNERGNLAFARDDYDSAERDFREALTIWKAVYGEKHPFVGLCYANLTGVLMHRKEYSEAEKMARKALDVYGATLPTNHVNFAIVHVKLGRILMHEGHYQEAEAESLAGYRYFSQHESGYTSYLSGARKDLIETEMHLGQPVE